MIEDELHWKCVDWLECVSWLCLYAYCAMCDGMTVKYECVMNKAGSSIAQLVRAYGC